jgi:oxygen-independent coproporphyrinogen-3 oxidase
MQSSLSPMNAIERMLGASPYQGYVYGYPHKSAYRPLAEPVALGPLWETQVREALFYYLHIPFCEMRCGFCNLFTRANPQQTLVHGYVAALLRQIKVVGEILGASGSGGFALGGGTPTYLDAGQLEMLLNGAARYLAINPASVPSSVESSPATATADRLAVLRGFGIERVSIGVQSFHDGEVARCGRRQTSHEIHAALTAIRKAGFPILNVDLIYGIEGQTVLSWRESIRALLQYRPEEIYLYPLYVRPLTGLGKRGRAWDDQRIELYRHGRDLLLAEGYQQVSMRMFRGRLSSTRPSTYRCQQGGMVGLGCGARSYTRNFHYSHNYAVSGAAVEAIIGEYVNQSNEQFAQADYGMVLSEEEERRRYLLQSLLQLDGVHCESYRRLFGADPEAEFMELNQLADLELAKKEQGSWRLTAAGVERSDAIGPWLFSEEVRRSMGDFIIR